MRWIEATYVNRGLVLSRRITRGNWAALVFSKGQRKSAREGGHPGAL
jgi:hypothetical protein